MFWQILPVVGHPIKKTHKCVGSHWPWPCFLWQIYRTSFIFMSGHRWQGTRISQAIILLGNNSASVCSIHQPSFTFIWLLHGHYHSTATVLALRSKAGWLKTPAAGRAKVYQTTILRDRVDAEFSLNSLKWFTESDLHVSINDRLIGESQEVNG